MIDKLREGYIEEAYKRIWDNFVFSWKMYASKPLYQEKLCLESFEALDKLYQRFLETDKAVTRGLYNRYHRLIMMNYKQVR